ncbi:TPR-like protein [Jaminaea rosea]|uniref:TPR-like protein n=1 Tax=Jaminaea rosea TaxID=1569628 RepID=A0A316UZ66_9BASI|nr:TPR-like protein [Jaminaea rosea]PWN30088.1 TPR-like protein [Jaminaea rosea]
MPMSDLVGGGAAACGPSNPLQTLGKRFGQDRSGQLDRFNQAGSSRSSGFRSSPASGQHQQPQQDGFQLNPVGPLDLTPLQHALPHHHAPQAAHQFAPGVSNQANFEASFRAPPPAQQQHQPGPQSHAWSSDFLAGGPSQASASRQAPGLSAKTGPATYARQGGMPQRYGSPMGGFASHGPQMYQPTMYQQRQASPLATVQPQDDKNWSEAYTAYDSAQAPVTDAPPQQIIEEKHVHPEMTAGEADELARTAGRLVSTVEHDQNDKFKQSNFLNLMRKLRDREAGIQGDDIVPIEGQQGAAVASGLEKEVEGTARLDKGKGRAFDSSMHAPQSEREEIARRQAMLRGVGADGNLQAPMSAQGQGQDRDWLNEMWAEEDRRSEAIEERARQNTAANRAFIGDGGDMAARMAEDDAEAKLFRQHRDLGANVAGAGMRTGWEEKMDDDDLFSQEDFVGRSWRGAEGRGRSHVGQAAEWDKLQSDWDAFEAGPEGLRMNARQQPFTASRIPSYAFQQDNPYLATTRQHLLHTTASSMPEEVRSILESEAAVQADPTDSGAWYSLGVKQQENERERSAIAALHRAVQIDPFMKDAWLALAVSYTNESDRLATYEALERWIGANDRYPDVAAAHPRTTSSAPAERQAQIVSSLLSMARQGPGAHIGEVDADVQVALGVLFNLSDDFAKAVDCFSAAISVRPDDWLLYNRLGAVLSNSGRSEEALGYYRYALELKPDFARCHFNLAISCLNLKMFEEAARHTYTALSLQEAGEQRQQQHQMGKEKDDAGNNGSLWETLRVSLELMDRPDLANTTLRKDLEDADLVDFFRRGGSGVDGGDDGGYVGY